MIGGSVSSSVAITLIWSESTPANLGESENRNDAMASGTGSDVDTNSTVCESAALSLPTGGISVFIK
ncbi:hypothetical protein [Nocardia alni]|uniref:hypothetical protein n=1 Tax=Nocardia alni TaxID=2815723 RepID=UPI0020B31882|nr:hypothetical protein [Nocardia alni]